MEGMMKIIETLKYYNNIYFNYFNFSYLYICLFYTQQKLLNKNLILLCLNKGVN